MSLRRFIELASIGLLLLQLVACGAPARKPADNLPAGGGDPYLQSRLEVAASVQREFDAAVAAMQQQQWSTAERQLQVLAAAHPQLSGPPLNLALLAARDNRHDDAERWFRQAIAANGNNLTALNQYAIWLRERGRFGDAEATYRQALARWPDHADSHRNLGILLDLYLDNGGEALTHYQRYLELVGDVQTPVRGWVVELQRRNATGQGGGGE
jgi:Tfp pilus assembly protein PilF